MESESNHNSIKSRWFEIFSYSFFHDYCFLSISRMNVVLNFPPFLFKLHLKNFQCLQFFRLFFCSKTLCEKALLSNNTCFCLVYYSLLFDLNFWSGMCKLFNCVFCTIEIRFPLVLFDYQTILCSIKMPLGNICCSTNEKGPCCCCKPSW